MCKHLYKYLLREKRQNPLYTAARGQEAHAGLCTPEFEHLYSGSQQQVEEEMQKKYLGASGFLVCVCTSVCVCVCVCAGGEGSLSQSTPNEHVSRAAGPTRFSSSHPTVTSASVPRPPLGPAGGVGQGSDNSFAFKSTTAWPSSGRNRTMAGLSQK